METSRAAPTLEFVGTATTVLRLGPFTLLTGPNFLHRGQYAYLGKGLVTRRLTEPSLQPDQLPPLDAVVLSHLHGDHFDRIARRGLARDLPVLTTPAAARRLSRWGFVEADGLRTWDTRRLQRGGWGLTITSVPGTHAPGLLKPLLPPVMGSALELTGPGRRPFRLYVSGDTLHRESLRQVQERTGPLDAAVLHLGGTKVLGMLVTMDGEQGARLTELLDPRVVVPVHHDDYTRFRSPLADFLVACRRRGLADRVRTVGRGEVLAL